jgi:hypothetical protein
MKSNRFELYHWHTRNGKDIIEVDWPKVHKTKGIDQTRWLLSQPDDHCQIVLERRDMYCRLIAEFYYEETLVNYHLRWAK